jgi:hypothetical protein
MDYGMPALEQAAAWGFTMTRCDVLPDYDMDALAKAFVAAPVRPLFLIHDLAEPAIIPAACDILGPTGFAVELTNEPDLNDPWKADARGWADQINQTAAWARLVGFEGSIFSGGVSNLNKSGFDYLTRALPRLPDDLIIAIHRYPDAACDPLVPHAPARTRMEECERLVDLVHPRRVGHTEGGFHQAPRQIDGGFDLEPLTDEEVADRITYELTLFRHFGFETYTHYQITDGPGEDYGDHFGLFRYDGSIKDDIVKVFQSYREHIVH